MSLTSTFNSRFGDVTITISDGGTAATFETLGFATIDFDFDITPDQTDIDRVSVFYGRFSIQADNKDSLGNDLFDRLRTNIAAFTSVSMTVVVDRATDWEFNYKISRRDLFLSELTRKVTINGTPDIDITPTMADFTFTNTFPYSRREDEFWDAVGVGEFISGFVGALNSNLSNEITHATNITAGVSNPIYQTFDSTDLSTMAGERVLCLLDISSTDFDQVEEENIEDFSQFSIAASLAACEGAIFGTGFDRNFWVYRGATGTPVTVPWDNVLSLDDIELVEAFRSVAVGTREYDLPPTTFGIPHFGITKGVHISLQRWNRSAPKQFQFVDTPGIFFVSEGFVDDEAFAIINITDVNSSQTLRLGSSGSRTDTFSSDVTSRLVTCQNLAQAVNDTAVDIFADYTATVVEDDSGNGFHSVRLQTTRSPGDTIFIEEGGGGGTVDMTYTIEPNPTELNVLGYDANGRAANDLRLRALQAYTKVFPIGETFKISGVLSTFVKPWETFEFSGAPSRYTGKEFRLSGASYDLITEKMNFRAYEVE